ncbi:MAG: 1-acyl-sn-glycerol-3-phosphate acyltransferase, partial [Pseudomonadota bacterium]|nr:1-acyl-sn-glycerol-3-phosphate acyltransferase [Pseudomonadota bacterium]
MPLSIRLRSIAFNLALYGTTSVMCFLMLWVLPLPRRRVLPVVHLWLRQIVWMEKNIAGITYRVRGRAHVPKGACIIASKHQSAWETFKLHLLLGDPSIVLKQELMNIPIWGWYLRRSGMIPIDRRARGQA